MLSLAFRTRRYDIEYEYHFIEYEYDKSQNSATSKANGEEVNQAPQNAVFEGREGANSCRALDSVSSSPEGGTALPVCVSHRSRALASVS